MRTIDKLTKENAEREAAQEALTKLLSNATERATRAEIAEEEAKKQSSAEKWKKMYFMQDANFRAAFKMNQRVAEDMLMKEEQDKADFHRTAKHYSSSIYFPQNKRLPTDNLINWTSNINAQLTRKSHCRKKKFTEQSDFETGKKFLEEVDDFEGGGQFIGQYNYRE